METRTLKELERRVALVLAQSFKKTRFLEWDSLSKDKALAELELQIDNPETIVAFLDYKGSGLVKLDNRPYWSLDGYHKSFPLPIGRHLITSEFSGLTAFGDKTSIHPGAPI